MQSRRDGQTEWTINRSNPPHAGLWLDRYLRYQRGSSGSVDSPTPEQQLVKETADIAVPKLYGQYFKRWRQGLTEAGALCLEATVDSRMIVGLGAESVIETAVTLHHTYGVPYIPGSALKGLASSFAHQRLAENAWRKLQGYAHRKIFGVMERAGSITFYDALYVPGTAGNRPLHPDIMTPHHKGYYRNRSEPPADWDNPTPVSFLSATGSYLLAVAGPEPWRQAAMTLLLEALQEMGIGGKTSSGYGRLTSEDSSHSLKVSQRSKSEVVDEQSSPILAQFRQQLDAMPNHKVASEIHAVYQRWQGLEADDANRRNVAQVIVDKVRQANREGQSKEKAWYQQLLAALDDEV